MRKIRKQVEVGLLAFAVLGFALYFVVQQGVLLGVSLIALIVSTWMRGPARLPPPDDRTITPWRVGSGPL